MAIVNNRETTTKRITHEEEIISDKVVCQLLGNIYTAVPFLFFSFFFFFLYDIYFHASYLTLSQGAKWSLILQIFFFYWKRNPRVTNRNRAENQADKHGEQILDSVSYDNILEKR